MLLPHPKYKSSFIVLPAPSFSNKLIASETWMTLESEALSHRPGFLGEEVPSPGTTPALSHWGGCGVWLCCAPCSHAAQLLPSCTWHCPAPMARGPCSQVQVVVFICIAALRAPCWLRLQYHRCNMVTAWSPSACCFAHLSVCIVQALRVKSKTSVLACLRGNVVLLATSVALGSTVLGPKPEHRVGGAAGTLLPPPPHLVPMSPATGWVQVGWGGSRSLRSSWDSSP